VELQPLNAAAFKRILTETQASLVRQYKALMGTEGLELTFDEAAVDEIARLAEEINTTVENIGARRLHTVMERLLEEISFDADEKKGSVLKITAELVREKVGSLAKNSDLSKFIL
jgi:ATP-dependent HslUV protease ATP-binding subunit HslU